MGIMEARPLSQHPNEQKNSVLLTEEELESENERRLANEQLAKLLVQAQSGNRLLWYLRQSGIWMWVEGDDKNVLGIHSKKEHGRDYDALMRVAFEPEGAVVDMVFEHDGQQWADHIDSSRETPPVMLAVLDDITEVERTLSWTRYHNQTSDPRYVTNMGPGLIPPR